MAKNTKMATPMSIVGQNSISRTEGLRELIFTKMFAIDSFDNPEMELFLTRIVFSQYKTHLACLIILAECDFLVKMALYYTSIGPC